MQAVCQIVCVIICYIIVFPSLIIAETKIGCKIVFKRCSGETCRLQRPNHVFGLWVVICDLEGTIPRTK